MKNKCTVIQISGFRGILIAVFLLVCAVAGFVMFPAWCCQHAWNYVAKFFVDMPLMELKHGVLLWAIIALISYVTLFGKFSVALVSSKNNVIDDEPIDIEKDELELIRKIKKDVIEEIEKEELKK